VPARVNGILGTQIILASLGSPAEFATGSGMRQAPRPPTPLRCAGSLWAAPGPASKTRGRAGAEKRSDCGKVTNQVPVCGMHRGERLHSLRNASRSAFVGGHDVPRRSGGARQGSKSRDSFSPSAGGPYDARIRATLTLFARRSREGMINCTACAECATARSE
jgi:hypothetical protein